MEDFPDGIDRIAARLDALEQRVYALEHPAGATVLDSMAAAASKPVSDPGDTLTAASAVGSFSVLGKAMLGIAGAYLLRALAELNVLPSIAVAAVAVAYALVWLVVASRVKSGDWFSESVYACTSALILAPMLWELTLRFAVLNASVAAAVVAGFTVAATALVWKREPGPVIWVANLTAAASALALSVASYQMVPFICTVLLMVLISEYRALRGKESSVRIVVSLAADVAIWALIFIYSGQESARTSYPPLGSLTLIAPGMMLFAIVGGSVIYQTLIAGKRITTFESIQTTAAFLLALCGLFYFGSRASMIGFGALCLGMAVAGYAATLTRFKSAEGRRNRLLFAGWSGALLLAGSMMCMPERVQPPWLGVWSITATWTGMRMLRLHLELHGLIFLLVAAAGSGLLNWMASELAGTAVSGVAPMIYLIAICAFACYACAASRRDGDWRHQAVATTFAAIAMSAATALLVCGLMGLVALGITAGLHHLAFVRTLTISGIATGLAFSGSRWGRPELTRIGYAMLALLVLKLAVEDMRHGQLAYIAGSIFVFAITLIVVPRVARLGQRLRDMVVVKDRGLSSLPR